MSVESVRKFFKDKSIDISLMELGTSGATVELASQSIGVAPELIAKTLAFKLKDKNILIVTKGDARIDNKKYKQLFFTKAKMLNAEEVLEITGHPVGGVCPFGLKTTLEIYLDISIKDFHYVYPAAGGIHSAMKITPTQIAELTDAEWVDVCESPINQ
jgi:prolyl-tRNA editing enzyme YbaK/EbsC (Cys-tRNA(Pro) deacylase)